MITLQLTNAQCNEILDALANQRADMRAMRDECRVKRVADDLCMAILDSVEISETIKLAITAPSAKAA